LRIQPIVVYIKNTPLKSKTPIHIRAMAIVMLFAMFHYMVGYRLMYSLGILYAKDEAKECMNMKNNSTQKITLSASEYNSLKWTEKDKEFSFNNEMYDVVSIQKAGNKYIITVYSDNTETSWVTSLHNYEKELFYPDQTTKGAKSAEDIMSSFQKDYTSAPEFKLHIFACTGHIQPGMDIQQHPLQVPKNIWHPPTVC
jgi:hypothetical protein